MNSPVDPYEGAVSTTRFLLHEDMPGILHSSYAIDNFYFTDRLDLFAVVEPGCRALFVDTGHPSICGTEPLDRVVEDFDVPWENVEVFVTHFHDDHDGSLQYLLDRGAGGFFCGPAVPWSEESREAFLHQTGAVRAGDCALVESADFLMGRDHFTPELQERVRQIPEGSVLSIAGYDLEVLYTPGHTVEHASLVDRAHGFIFAGDHLIDSAPGLMQFHASGRLLARFFQSIGDIKAMRLTTAFTSHRDSFASEGEVDAFIESILERYEKPLDRVRGLMRELGRVTVYELASAFYAYLPHGMAGEPESRRVRRVAIPFAYLDYLAERGELVRREDDDGCFVYEPVRGRVPGLA